MVTQSPRQLWEIHVVWMHHGAHHPTTLLVPVAPPSHHNHHHHHHHHHRHHGLPSSRSAPTCEDGDAVETAVQLAQEDGEEAVGSQAGHVPRALVIDHHVLVLLCLHLQGMAKKWALEKLRTCFCPWSISIDHSPRGQPQWLGYHMAETALWVQMGSSAPTPVAAAMPTVSKLECPT